MKIARSLQSLSFLAISASWFVFILTGTQPSMFVTAFWTTIGALTTAFGIEGIKRVVA
jgi:high-affinity K+ transport system ATPase subunit B